tara:strand:+ start:668 stop:958 length:291 start_codon:yes stop_codon:yes gene_type:complete
MKITKRQLRRIIKEEKAKLIAERTESGNPQSYGDLAAQFDTITRMVEDLTMDYVDSGWLNDGDHASLANDLDKLFQDTDKLSMAFFGLARSQGELA